MFCLCVNRYVIVLHMAKHKEPDEATENINWNNIQMIFYVSGGSEPLFINIYGLSSFYVGCLQKQVSYKALIQCVSICLRYIYLLY